MVERRLTGMITAAVVLIVLFIFWDAFKPTPRRATARTRCQCAAQNRRATAGASVPGRAQTPPPTTKARRGPRSRPVRTARAVRTSSCWRAPRHGAASVERRPPYLGEMLETGGDHPAPLGESHDRADSRVVSPPIAGKTSSRHSSSRSNRLRPVDQRRCPGPVRLRWHSTNCGVSEVASYQENPRSSAPGKPTSPGTRTGTFRARRSHSHLRPQRAADGPG